MLLSLSLRDVRAQSVDSCDVMSTEKNIILSLLLPKGIAEGIVLRSYIRSNSWKDYIQSHTPRESLDEIYFVADELCHSTNKQRPLFATCIAVLDHKTIPIKLPFGLSISLPLTLESAADYSARVSQLPQHIYIRENPDVDKLQHFFFSAFFESVLKMNWLVRLLGEAVEIGEDLFVIGGVNDPRDKHANNDGISFGEHGDDLPLVAPSTYLTPNP